MGVAPSAMAASFALNGTAYVGWGKGGTTDGRGRPLGRWEMQMPCLYECSAGRRDAERKIYLQN